MTLIDEARSEELYARMGPGREISGGSVGNTIAAIASMGGTPAYIGRVKDDQLGRIFAHDIRAAGVAFEAAAGGRRAGHRPLPDLRHAGRAAHHADLSRRLRRSRAGGGRGGPRGARRGHLFRGLSLRQAGGQGGLPEGGRHLPRPGPAPGAQPLRSVLRRPLAATSFAPWSRTRSTSCSPTRPRS